MEVSIRFPNGFIAIVIVGTPQNVKFLMEKDKVNFYGPGLP
jgi:hypothetical protein